MSKSGRERKAKRKVRKRLEAEIQKKFGSHWIAETKKQEIQNNALMRQAIRWMTNATKKQWDEVDPNEITCKELAILVTRRNMLSADQAVANAAVRNLLAMEAQNQADQRAEQANKEPSRHLHLHQAPQIQQPVDPEKLLKALQLLDEMEAKLKSARARVGESGSPARLPDSSG